MNWTENDINRLKQQGKIRGFSGSPKKYSANPYKNIPVPGRSAEKEWLSLNLAMWCNEHALMLETEYKFHPERKFRFDWAIPAIMVAIEYEGVFSAKSRHTTISGFIGDVAKYNIATVAGWRVIRLTAKDYKTVIEILNLLIK